MGFQALMEITLLEQTVVHDQFRDGQESIAADVATDDTGEPITQIQSPGGDITVSTAGGISQLGLAVSQTFQALTISVAYGANGGILGRTALEIRNAINAAQRATPAIVAATIPLAKITGGGADGSLTVNAEGIVTAYVAPT